MIDRGEVFAPVFVWRRVVDVLSALSMSLGF